MPNQNDAPNQIMVDEAKVKRILGRIIIAETRNIQSGEKSDKQMIKMIMDKIKEEVECY